MPVRDDILNFMRSIKAGKQAVRETEFKQEAVEEAQKQYDKTLEDYARGLTSYEEELPLYQQRVADWQSEIDSQQSRYDADLNKYYGFQPAIVDFANTYKTLFRSPEVATDPSTWSDSNKRLFTNVTGYDLSKPPPMPQQPVYQPQPQMTVDHPGDMPSFEFVMPDTPYSSALAKSSQMGSLPSLGSRDQGRYYQAINAQSNQPKWWQR